MITQRKAGVLMHISTLPGDYSIGGFGEECKEFVDFLAEGGFQIWQVLPFCLPDAYHSPYSSYSAFSINPYFISLPILKEAGLLTEEELAEAKQIVSYTCEFKRLEEDRFALLEKAAKRVENKEEIYQFLKANPRIETFCRFMAIKQKNDMRCWQKWTTEEYDEEIYFAWAFTQFEGVRQWNEIKSYANQKGISIIGDIPIYVSYDSAEVWANPQLFMLDEDKNQTEFAGCPPDYFAKEGQFWGNPIYRWDSMKQDGFSFWKERLSHMLTLFDGVRLDHFRGFSTYWSIPKNAKSAKEGKWKKGPGRAFVDEMKKIAGDKLIIAEDLGEATPDVERLLKYSGFPGMRVYQFGFDGNNASPHLPHNYVKNAVAYTGTHDNDTMLGYVWRVEEAERHRMALYSGNENRSWEAISQGAVRALYASVANYVIFPIQDLLCFGNDTRLNTPGVAKGNWGFRITKNQLLDLNPSHFMEYAKLFGRYSETESK